MGSGFETQRAQVKLGAFCPFLILFFLFYVGIAVLYASRQAPDLKGYVDGTLVFGTPIIAFGLQAGMMLFTPPFFCISGCSSK